MSKTERVDRLTIHPR